ncbi:methionyl-tRNA formyltransferase [Thiorhodospira sibirica]|uniref:methionyl-tRNA formyltransferase n=1 Tax=Thiorhodospira sibirica TaxID=154347 RepID=UPI00022C52B0|nr:methionyl-tRNA formyltransferase [Thiorhodospira sibirica]
MSTPLRIVYAGTPEFALHGLSALLASAHEVVAVYTQPDRPAGRGRQLTPSPVKQMALAHGLTVEQPVSLKAEAAQAQLRAYAPDLMVVAAYGLILPPAVLALPRYGCINLHASLLPRWRGAAPIQRALLAGDAQTGITLMQMAAGLDTGEILLRLPCAIETTDTAQSLHDRLAKLSAQALMQGLEALQAGTLTSVVQDDSLVTYAAKLSKAEALLDWSLSAVELDRCVRAYNPWPVAYTRWQGENLRIWESTVLDTQASPKPPGQVLTESANGIDVATGQGVLRITRLQLPGAKALDASEFIKGHSLLGVCF